MCYGEHKIWIFSLILVLVYFHSLGNSLDHNPPKELVNGIILSVISTKKEPHNASTLPIPLLPCGKKDSIRRFLEGESGKNDSYFEKHNKSWLNVDQSLKMDLFYEGGLHLIKEGN